MKQFPLLLILLALGLAMPGCMDRTELVDQTNDTEIVAGLDYKDFTEAAENTLRTILKSPKVIRETPITKTYVVAIGRVVDATPLNIDTDVITARISEALLEDDRFTVSSVFADKLENQDSMLWTTRDFEDAAGDELDPTTLKPKGKVKVPDFTLTGKLIARDVKRDNGGHQYEYYIQLRFNDVSTGTTLAAKETRIVKRTGKKDHTW